MNHQKENGIRLLATVAILIGTCILISSCERYHFETPQPTDVPNEFVFPNELRGNWKDDKKKDQLIVIQSNSINMSGYDSLKLINKIASLADSSKRNDYIKYVRLNKETKKLDTLTDYIVRGNRIYSKSDEGLAPGIVFTLKNDTLYAKIEFSLNFELSEKVRLRKLSDHKYVLNIREELFAGLTKGPLLPWWQVLLLELTSDNQLYIKEISDSVRNEKSLIYSTGSDYYFDASWTKSEFIKKVDKGLFKELYEKLHRSDKPNVKKK